MALKKDFVKTLDGFDGTLTSKDVYWKVTNISGNKDSVSYNLEGFKGDVQVFGYSFSFDPDLSDKSGNFIAQAYDHAKTLSEFSGSEDV
tara:strand:- start:268 stop:534 length:267 start_codon:yes stop_codon:yes gene_type:complete